MPNTKTATGVCAVCKYDPECIYEASSRSAILQCEQFEMKLPEQAPPQPAQARGVPGHATDTNGYAGLCPSCNKRKTCTYPRPEGGVWRCEEYV